MICPGGTLREGISMGFDLNLQISAVTVFIQGILSFFSPCVLPLLPLYMSYLAAGTAVRDDKGVMHYDRKTVMLHTVLFVIGVSAAFFILGLGMSALGRLFGNHRRIFAFAGGVIVILFGLYQLGVFGEIPFLNRERKLSVKTDVKAMSPWTALVLGFVFSFSWTPCIGPVLSGVLLMAASASGDSAARGFSLIAIYTAGFIIPFLLVGLFTASLLELFRKHSDLVRLTGKAGGALLVLMGVLMLTGSMNKITGYLSRFPSAGSPAAEETVTSEQESIQPSGPESEEAGPSDAVSGSAQEEKESTAGSNETPSEPAANEKTYPAIDFDLIDQYGNRQVLSSYKGKIVFLNFWATWCPPCRAEMPAIQELHEYYEAHPEEDVVILGVAAPSVGQETDEAGITDFLNRNGYTYPVAFDTGGRVNMNYAIMSIPTTYMIDREGNLFGYISGSMDKETMQAIIEQTKSGKR